MIMVKEVKSMLLNITINNFRSFNKEQTFSMVDSGKREYIDTLIKTTTMGKKLCVLPINIIYGANAGGKTNIFKACELLKQLFLNGTINSDNKIMKFFEAYYFMHDSRCKEIKPISLSIEFIYENNLYKYTLSILPAFSKNSTRSIVNEELFVNNIRLFKRGKDKIEISKSKNVLSYFDEKNESNIAINERQVNAKVDSSKLFLMSSFEDIIAPTLVSQIFSWFSESFHVFNELERTDITPNLSGNLDDVPLEVWMRKIITLADIGPQEFKYHKSQENDEFMLYTNYQFKSNKKIGFEAPARITESKGTLKLTDVMMPIVDAIFTGGTLLIDEFDASLHPSIVSNIITILTDLSINKKGAQLIFNTHNPIYLNKNLVRRDEITFVDKNKDFESEIYSLADYCRNDADYAKNYINGEYGAIRYVDLAEVFEDINDE